MDACLPPGRPLPYVRAESAVGSRHNTRSVHLGGTYRVTVTACKVIVSPELS